MSRPPMTTAAASQRASVPGAAARRPIPPHAISAIHDVASRRDSHLGRWIAGAALLAGLGVGAALIARNVRKKPTVTSRPDVPAAVAAIGADRLELAPDGQTLSRISASGPRWSQHVTVAIKQLEVTDKLVFARSTSSLVALDPGDGTPRFSWELPAGERWAATGTLVAESCIAVVATRGNEEIVHCLDRASGAPRWEAKLANICPGTPVAIAGMYAVACGGSTSLIDDRNGNVSVDPDTLGVVQRDPALLLRSRRGRLTLSHYYPKEHRFSSRGIAMRGLAEAPVSAVQRTGRVIVRASSATTTIATIVQEGAPPAIVTVPGSQLSDDSPFVDDCGAGGTPRFQLVELALRTGTSSDPADPRQRTFALVDTDAARVTWTSKVIVPPTRTSAGPMCKYGHYFVPLESGLWIVDANAGTTRGAFASAASNKLRFADLAAVQIGEDDIVMLSESGAIALPWHQTEKLPEDARDALERELGALP